MKIFFNKTIETINEKISNILDNEEYVEFKKEKFPNETGIYFIYEKQKELVYIGCGHLKTIQERVNQYITPSDTGATFTKKVMAKKLQTPMIIEDGKVKNKDDMRRAIEFIKLNYTLKFIRLNNWNSRDIQTLESICISANKPIYND